MTINTPIRFHSDKTTLQYLAVDDTHPKNGYEGIIYLMKDMDYPGCSVVSDIDDTIKISEVPFKTKLLVNTFKKRFIAVPGKVFK